MWGSALLVERILTKDTCAIHTIDLRQNAITAAGLRQAIMKLSVLNYTLSKWLLEEPTAVGSGTDHNGSQSGSQGDGSGGSSSGSKKSRPGPSTLAAAKKEKEKDKAGSSSGSSSSSERENGEPREIMTMRFQEIVDKYVAEFLKMNRQTMAVTKGEASHLHLKFDNLKHPRLCPTRMAKLVLSLQHATSLTIEGWKPPPPLTLKGAEKKLSKLSAEQIAFKELKRQVPGTLFASLPKLTELRVVKCVRVDIEKVKKGTLRGLFSTSSSSSSKSSSGKDKDKEKDKERDSKDGSLSSNGHLSGSATASSSTSGVGTLSSTMSTNSSGAIVVKSTFLPTVPLEIGAMPSLRRLTLSECGLEEITTAALPFMSHVEQIDFGINDITIIPAQISSLSNVTRLFLHSNSITEIPPQLSSMRYLRELWLYDNLIQRVPSDLAKWFPVLKDLRILTQHRLEEQHSLSMDDPELLEYRSQEEDLIKTKSTIGCIGFLGLLKLSQAPEVILYKSNKDKKKK